MMILKMRFQSRVLVSGLLVVLFICGLSAFSRAAEKESPVAAAIRRDVEREMFKEAMQAFKAKDYKKAKRGFEILSELAQTPDINHRALFGLASVKLDLARTAEEYENAISSWKKWDAQANPCGGCEDPRMLTPFLMRLESSVEAETAGPAGAKGRKAKSVDFMGILQTKEKEMQTLRSKLEASERKVHQLRHQLESLEQIHRVYEEKKLDAAP